jgi:hypothetical protein
MLLNPLAVSKQRTVVGKIPKHCHQKLEFMIMTPGLGHRKGLKYIFTHDWKKINRALFMLP